MPNQSKTVFCVLSGVSTQGCNDTPKHICTLLETCHHRLLGRAVVFSSVPPPSCMLSSVSPFWQLAWGGSSVLSATPVSTTHLPLIRLIAFHSTASVFRPGLITRPLPVHQLLWGHHPFDRIRNQKMLTSALFVVSLLGLQRSWRHCETLISVYFHRLTVYPFFFFSFFNKIVI